MARRAVRAFPYGAGVTRLPPETYLAHLRTESARFRDVLAACDPAARVPSCPDWSAAEAAEFEAEVAPVAEALGYEYRVARLAGGAAPAGGPPVALSAALSRLFG